MALRSRRPARNTLAAALVRAAPFVLGAVAMAAWLRRRHAQRPELPVRAGAAEPAAAPPATVADEPAGRPRTGRFERAASSRLERADSGRFARAPERRPIDIVTVVDDLLGATG